MIKGVSVCNPVEVEKEYLLFTVDYAKKLGFDHIQVIGPIHDGIRGNIDGMTPYRKYSVFNGTKDDAYVRRSVDAVNAACERAKQYGIKMYQWHHELDLPAGFQDAYPEICNRFGDVEVTHPLVKDFLEHKLADFFHTYPGMDGLILTLHETKVPLLKLKDQKLGKVERVKYVTQVLYNTCKALGKELIVRPFASIEEDYTMMTKAYEEIGTDLMIMDKWTQFDWSLTMPHNRFYSKIRKNPLFVEADIFGEFFGKGRLPLMLKDHIAQKIAYCSTFSPAGYVARIDRSGQIPFGNVNEVNNIILAAHLNSQDPDAAIDGFFREKYGEAAGEIKALMEPTEEILKRTFYVNGYYFTELSRFPTLNHSKNHFYFEMMRENYCIDSGEWFIPKNWDRGTLESLLKEKNIAAKQAADLYARLTALKDRLKDAEYQKLWLKFANLKLVTQVWKQLTAVFMDYAGYFETGEKAWEEAMEQDLEALLVLRQQGVDTLGNAFYCLQADGTQSRSGQAFVQDYIGDFVREVRESFRLEKEAQQQLKDQPGVADFIICGGAMEGHCLHKEVNFSDTLVKDGALCRIPGNRRGMEWSSINAHGWFSYALKITPHRETRITVLAGTAGSSLDVKITLGDNEHLIHRDSCQKEVIPLTYIAGGENCIRIRFDKISGNTPCVYSICVDA